MAKQFILSLGSGGLRGFIHLGVYRALYENKIKIDAIYGTSVGGLVGAFISEAWEPDQLIDLAMNLSPSELLDFTLPINGYILGKKLNLFIKKYIKTSHLENLPIPLTIVAVRTRTGEAEYFNKGVLSDCIQASSAIPNVFRPVVINNIEYLDGDLCSPVPVKKAREEHKNAVILAVNIIPQAEQAPRNSLKWAKLISRTIYRQSLVNNEKIFADIFINADMDYSSNLISKKKAIERIEIGYQETLKIIPELQQILATV